MTADLSGIRSLLAGITGKEWFLDSDGHSIYYVFHNGDTLDRDRVAEASGADAAFIAAAPSTVARLLGIVERVEALHTMERAAVPVWKYGIKSGGEVCGLDGQAWPCETIAAITGEGE